MKLEFTAEEFASIQAYPLPWWAPEPRQTLGKTVPGIPGAVHNDEGVIVGYAMNHKSINYRDVFMLELLRAGWVYISEMTLVEQIFLQTLQMNNDWAAWNGLKARFDDEDDDITIAEAEALIWTYIGDIADTLDVTVPDPPGDEEE